MNEVASQSEFFREYSLIDARRNASKREPAPHQARALKKLQGWFGEKPGPPTGGLLVLPTGAGKTFTAMRFLASGPLSEGYKVLWLAHTHHLLDQAFEAVETSVGSIHEPRESLSVRVVSGTPGHFPVHSVKPTDDFLIGTLQTIQRALKERQPSFDSFLEATQGKLFVVFDEAHHAPAPSYTRMLLSLRERFPGMFLLGLTATPRYTSEKRAGWLKELFPQEILHEESAEDLMAAGVLARPILEEPVKTEVDVELDEREYQKWLSSFQDIPEFIINDLARNQARNDLIVNTYVNGRQKYGKTIIFADRWHQCDYMREALRQRGVAADVVYSHIDADPGSAEARARRTRDDNARVLDAFRRNELQVLVNVRMLTEGTDVPDVETVFVTRQTTSQILLTQMIGRALRGPQFNGTTDARVVLFMDNWKQMVHWAIYGDLVGGFPGEAPEPATHHPPLEVISIDLVRRLARAMDTGENVAGVPFVTLLPLGWYRVSFLAAAGGGDETPDVSRMVLVYESQKGGYEEFIAHIRNTDLSAFEDENLTLAEVLPTIDSWRERFFPAPDQSLVGGIDDKLLWIARHVAQSGEEPQFFPFEARQNHNLDLIALRAIDEDWGPTRISSELQQEFNRPDRYWGTLFYHSAQFKSQFDACLNRILEARMHERAPETYIRTWINPERVPIHEPSEEVKQQVVERDERTCLACGEQRHRLLQVDHVRPSYLGGSNLLDDLQTLCAECNRLKGNTKIINFRDPQTDLREPLPALEEVQTPRGEDARAPEIWERFLRRTVNFFYRCGAVHQIIIGQRGPNFHEWGIELRAGNDPVWLEPHLARLLNRIGQAKFDAGYNAPRSIHIEAPDRPEVRYALSRKVELNGHDQQIDSNGAPGDVNGSPRAPLLPKRTLLDRMTAGELREIVDRFDIEVEDRRSREALVDAVARSHRASHRAILELMPVPKLRECFDDLGLRPKGRSKMELIDELLGK